MRSLKVSVSYSSHGVQIGGVGSAMGIIGVWTTTHHDQGTYWVISFAGRLTKKAIDDPAGMSYWICSVILSLQPDSKTPQVPSGCGKLKIIHPLISWNLHDRLL